jgi:hypothetical protein
MYLILSHTEAEKLNISQGKEVNLKGTSVYRWLAIKGDSKTALDVEDGEGLTDDEINKCVEVLPDNFISNWN